MAAEDNDDALALATAAAAALGLDDLATRVDRVLGDRALTAVLVVRTADGGLRPVNGPLDETRELAARAVEQEAPVADGITTALPLLAGDAPVGVLVLSGAAVSPALVRGAAFVAEALRRIVAEASSQLLRDEAEALFEVAGTLAGHHRLEDVVQAATDAATKLIGAQFGAFFYNTANEDGGRYTLFAIAGVDRSHFEHMSLPRNTPVFDPTFSGRGTVRYDDVTAQEHYGQLGPHHGMPHGHLPVRSYLAAPVTAADGRVLGGLFFGHEEVGRFTAGHERIVRGIAAQASPAVTTALEYEREHRLAIRFQQSFLQAAIPQLPGAAVAARYRPASVAHVGGDWYDLTPLPDGRMVVSIGDVAGHSVEAAVAMGQLRTALKAYAVEGLAPDVALDRLDEFHDAARLQTTATVIHGIFDPATGGIDLARAGHPPPLVVTDGRCEFPDLEDWPGPLLGARLPAGRRPSIHLDLRPHDRLVLFTDGLVEHRTRSLDESYELLTDAACGEAGSVEELAASLVDRLVTPDAADDVAVVIIEALARTAL